MTKTSKSTSTIRRRKIRYSQGDLERLKNSRLSSPTPLEEIREFSEADDGYLFDDEVLGPSIVKKIMSSEKTLLLSLISLRIANALFIQTHFVPDEFWQSLEVAHKMVFGYGYLTWEWKNGLRGYLYPSVFAVLYKMLAVLGLDNRVLLVKLPRMLQGVVAAWGDLYLYKLSWSLCDRATAQWTLLCQITSWFMLYCYTRTLTNSTETTLIIVALYYFPWPGKQTGSKSTVKFLTLAALSIIIRPTAAVIWVLLCSWHLQSNKHRIFSTLKPYVIVGCVSLAITGVIDRICYGEWTFVQYNFLKFNVLSGGGSFYGTHPWHWYVTQGYPVVMATHLAPFLLGAWKAKNKVLLFVIIWTLFIYSFLAHKEFRFVMPILPLSFHYCGVYFQSLCKKPRMKRKHYRRALLSVQKTDSVHGSRDSLVSSVDGSESTTTEISDRSAVSTETSGISSDLDKDGDMVKDNDKDPDTDSVAADVREDLESEHGDNKLESTTKKCDLSANEIIAELEKKQRETHRHNLSKAKIFVIILLLTNVPCALYFSLIHQRGTILVMKYIHDASQEKTADVLFLMPCHSTPYYSHVHRNISMRFLTCEPNLEHRENYTDEAEVFFNDPVDWLKGEYSATSRPWPSHVVYFDSVQKQLNAFLSQNGYKDCAKYFHSHVPEGRVGSHVLVSCR